MARGIASLVDTLFLMLIAAGAMAIIFYAAYHYGTSVGGELDKLRVEFYTRQVLKSLSAYTTERSGGVIDYLLAYMKEDVYNYGELRGSARELNEFLKKSLSLISSAYDYAFTLKIDAQESSVYYILGRVFEKQGSTYMERTFACSTTKDIFNSFTQSVLSLPEVLSSYTIFFFKTKEGKYYPAYVTLYLWPSGIGSLKGLNVPC